MHLHDRRFDKKTRLAAAGAADDENIFVSRILWLLRAAVHGKPFRLRQQHVILKYRVGVGLNIFGSPP